MKKDEIDLEKEYTHQDVTAKSNDKDSFDKMNDENNFSKTEFQSSTENVKDEISNGNAESGSDESESNKSELGNYHSLNSVHKDNHKTKSLIFGLGIGLLIGISGCALIQNHNQDALVTMNNGGRQEMVLSKNQVIDNALSSNNKSIMIDIMHGVLIKKYGNKFLDDAQKKYELMKVASGGEKSLDQELMLQGMTPSSYLNSIQNSMIIQHEIYQKFIPSKDQLKQAYNEIPTEYQISGVYVTQDYQKKGNSDQVAKKIQSEIEQGKSVNDILNQKEIDGCILSGIGLNKSSEINQISSDNYIQLTNAMKDAIKGHHAGDVVIGNDPNMGKIVIQIQKIQNRQSFDKEKSKLTKNLKMNESIDLNAQTKFMQQEFKKVHLHSSNPKLEKQIKQILENQIQNN